MTAKPRDSAVLLRLWMRDRSFVLVILQLCLFVLGFALLLGFHIFVLGKIELLDRTYLNEQSRLMLAQQINLNLVGIESNFYKIAASTSPRRQVAIKESAVDLIRDTRKLLGILGEGGTYLRDINVNLEDQEYVSSPITFLREAGQSEYVLEIIDLAPKLVEVESKVEDFMTIAVSLRDFRDRETPHVETESEIKTFLKQIPPIFTRMRENTNRIHVDSIQKFTEIDQLTADRKQRYQVIEALVTITTMFVVILFGWIIAQQVKRTGAALRNANERMEKLKNEAEESERHNAAINRILEISIQELPLRETLENVLTHIMSVSWLVVESQGSIFLADSDNRRLELVAHHHLAPELQKRCADLPYGKCLCGRAAETGEAVFSAHMDNDHEITFPGIHPHGHICLPIKSQDRLLGVLNLYVSDGCERSSVNEYFLQIVTKTIATIIERKQAEEMLRKLSHAVEQSPATVVITDLNGTIEYVNPMFCEKTGYTFEEAIGKNPRILKSGHTSAEMYKELWQTLKEGRTWRGEFLTCKKNGDQYWESASISPIRTKSGRTSHYVAVKEDVTERKRIECELRDATEVAKQASRAKSDFLANMSHEIRTPMNAVIGLSHLALQTDLDQKQQDYLEKIQSSAKALLGIINDILDFSKIEAGRMSVEATPFELDEVINHVFTVAGVKAAERGVNLFIVKPPETPASLIGDPLRLGQVLTNLIGNAIKFTEEGEIILEIELTEAEDGLATLRFSVRDSGIGMTDDQVAKLFKSFSQADTSTTRKYGGTGLGLAISDRLVSLMGGEFHVESVLGEGSTFTFTAGFGIGDAGTAERLGERSFLTGKTAFIVDDNTTAREMYRNMLTAYGLEVTPFTSADDLADAMAGDPRSCNLLVIDLNLPISESVENLHRIRASCPGSPPPAIVIIGFDQTQTETVLEGDPECEVLLSKPVTPSTMSDTILKLLGRSVATPQRTENQQARDVEAIQNILGVEVLVAEDAPINQQVAQEIFEGFGANVTIAENGRIAVEKLRDQPFDILFMDIQMPEMDGYEATRLIRSDNRFSDLPIVAMTAHAMDSDQKKSLEAGMNDHVSKPIDPDALFGTLARWIPSDRHVTLRNLEHKNGAHAGLNIPSSVIDSSAAIKRLGGDVAIYGQLLDMYLESNRHSVEEIEEAIGAGDRTTAVRLAHALKGIAGNIGAVDLARHLAELEVSLKDSAVTKEIVADTARCQVAVLAAIEGEGMEAVPSDAVTPPASALQANLSEILALLAKLDSLVTTGDLDSVACVSKLRNAVQESHLQEPVDRLARQIEEFDFEEAARSLAKVKKQVRVSKELRT